MTIAKPAASLSLDLDNQWSYMKTHGDPGWEDFPSYLDLAVPRFLEVFAKQDSKVSVFVVGKDAELEKNRSAFQAIANAGHEIANHSHMHEPWLHLYSRDQIVEELDRSEAAIEKATGHRTVGFRGPGFTFSADVLKQLSQRGYMYDASTFPTFIGPLAKMYFMLTASFNREQKQERKNLFGSLTEVFRTNRPYQWDLPSQVIEIPVTTIPIFKSPFHATYLTYLATFSKVAARRYFDLGLTMCRLTGIAPSVLYHPLDFIDENDCPELAFFPGMKLPYQEKIELLSGFMAKIARHYQLTTMKQHAIEIAKSPLKTARLPT